MKIIVPLVVLLILLPHTHSQIQKVDLPMVSEQTQNAVNFQINFLKLLVPTYNWLFCNKQMLYRVVVLASQALHQAAVEMKNYHGNIIQGSSNTIIGYGNVIIGSNNVFVGLDSWCFASDYHTPLGKLDQGILVIGNFKIVFSKASLILTDPTKAISIIDASQLQQLKKKNAAVSFFFK